MANSPEQQTFTRFLEQHRTLKELLGRIERVLAEQSVSIAEAAELLGRLGDQLVKHFALEETDGYFADALAHAPQLVARANDLLAQHPKMTHLAKELAGAEPGEAWWQETRQRFQAFLRELTRHERGEDQLVQEAYVRDLSATD